MNKENRETSVKQEKAYEHRIRTSQMSRYRLLVKVACRLLDRGDKCDLGFCRELSLDQALHLCGTENLLMLLMSMKILRRGKKRKILRDL